MTIFLKFETQQATRAHLAERGFPKTGRNGRTRRRARDDKQMTVRPFPVERSGSIRVMKCDESYTNRKNATEITEAEAHALGCFLGYGEVL